MADQSQTQSAPPIYIYKISPSDPALPLTPTNTLPPNYTMAPSDLDLKSGFIHLSSARQIPGTLTHFFASPPSDRTSLYLLKIPLAPLETAEVLRWESPDAKVCGSRDGEGMFPHVYFADGRLGLSDREVQSVREVVSEQGQLGWEAALAGLESWLV